MRPGLVSEVEDDAAVEGVDGGAVLGAPDVHVADRIQARGAGHVLNDDRGRAGNMLAHLSGNGAGVDVEAAPWGEADDDTHGLAAVEAVLRLRRGLRRDAKGEAE